MKYHAIFKIFNMHIIDLINLCLNKLNASFVMISFICLAFQHVASCKQKINYKIFCLYFLCSVFCSNVLAQITDPWQLNHKNNNVWVWNLTGQRQVMGTFQSQNRIKPIDWNKIKSKDFFLSLKRDKQKMLGLLGITHWTVNTSQWKKRSDHYELTLRGSYKSTNGQHIRFYEVHLFYASKTQQILVSHPQEVPIKRHLASQFINKAKRMLSQ